MVVQCKFCDKILANNYSLNRHFQVCKNKNIIKKEVEYKEEIEKKEFFYKKQLDIKEVQIRELKNKLEQLQCKDDKIYFFEDILEKTVNLVYKNFIVIKNLINPEDEKAHDLQILNCV
jgi:hypothetical protein